MTYYKGLSICLLSFITLACSQSDPIQAANADTKAVEPVVASNPQDDVVWAINVGGEAYLSSDGISYLADEASLGGKVVGIEGDILGTQDSKLYSSARQARQFSYAKALDNGRYSVTLRFAEGKWEKAGQRQFSVDVEGEQRIPLLDIVADRDQRNLTSYDISVQNVNVTDGELNIDFGAITDEASVSAIVVRKPYELAKDWKLIWQDEFNTDGRIDESKWNYEIWDPKRVNDELQRYTDRSENVRQEDGKLIIEARRDYFQGDEYSSARITSANKGDILYGRIEARALLPDGLGTWPAIWMMPTDFYAYAEKCSKEDGNTGLCNAWPNSGEMDIMEHVGFDEGRVHGTMHNKAFYWKNFKQRKAAILEPDVTKNFHLYALEWTPERIDVFIDDTLYFTYVNDHKGWQSWPYDKPFHVILNIAVGGGWGGAKGVADDIWPKRMLIDYVRMYQR